MSKSFIYGCVLSTAFVLSACSSVSMNSHAEIRTPASKAERLEGDAAVEFINKHFPNAEVPGPVEGEYNYGGTKKQGYAKCFYPVMGGRSAGQLPSCEVQY